MTNNNDSSDRDRYLLADAGFKARALVGGDFLSKFLAVVDGLSSSFEVELPLPVIDLSSAPAAASCLKSFCGGLIEGRDHPWVVPIRRLGLRDRWSLSFTLFLFRKVLPSVANDLRSYVSKVSGPSPCADPGLLGFIRLSVNRMFPVGWDRKYTDSALSFFPNSSACMQRGRKKGGVRGWWSERWDSHVDYVTKVLTGEGVSLSPFARVSDVFDGSKFRLVSVSDVSLSQLGPLHRLLYDHVSGFDWCLRGEALPSSFRGFGRVPGQVYVSGDYESATDALNVNVSRFILTSVLGRCTSVPSEISAAAVSSLEMTLLAPFESGEEQFVQRSGQMMGNYLSFPLLCLFNYLVFCYLTGGEVPLFRRGKVVEEGRCLPVRINGDDIVFRSSESVAKGWMEGVGGMGLVLSRGKTLVDKTFFTLNSSLFRGANGVFGVPFVRPKCLFPSGDAAECLSGFAGRSKSFGVRLSGRARLIWSRVFLRFWEGLIRLSGRSALRGLGAVGLPRRAFSGPLLGREVERLRLAREPPMPPPPCDLAWRRPPGWRFVRGEDTKVRRESSARFYNECKALSWEFSPTKVKVRDYISLVREGVRAPGWSPTVRRRGLLKLSRKDFFDFFSPRWCRISRGNLRGTLQGGGFGAWELSSAVVPWEGEAVGSVVPFRSSCRLGPPPSLLEGVSLCCPSFGFSVRPGCGLPLRAGRGVFRSTCRM